MISRPLTDLTDAGGGVASEYGYDVFGELRGQSGLPDDVMLFTGEQYDARARHNAPGLYYLRARYYDPTIGRFLSQDPVPSANLYAYVGNNPTNRVDPTGLRWLYGGEFGGGFDKEGGFKYFSGEWEVLVAKLGSGEPLEWVNIALWARVTLSGSGSAVYFNLTRDGSGVDVIEAKVFYQTGQFRTAELQGCNANGCIPIETIASATVNGGPDWEQPTRIELKLSRSLDTDVGTFIGSSTLTFDLESGDTSQNHCIPWTAAYLNQNVCW